MFIIKRLQTLSNTASFTALFTSLIKVASIFKVSFIIGAYMACFSATSIVMPLSGAFGGMAGACAVSGLILGMKLLCGSLISFKYLAYHIPGLFAALYWTTPSLIIRVVVPFVCMIAFIMHPVGGQAWVYSLYWLVPITLYFWPKKNLFFTALGSTFIAHAVGSVIWMYADPMSAPVWLGLIPIVALERLIFASGMVIMHTVLSKMFIVWRMRLLSSFLFNKNTV